MFGPQSEKLRLRAAGGLVLLLVLGVLYLALTANRGLPFVKTTTMQAAIGDVHSLKIGDQVREHSRRIGQVSDISYANGAALVSMKLDGEPRVYADAAAKVWDFSSLGAKFVELDPGTEKTGPLGDKVIPATQGENSADIYQLFDVFDEQTRSKLVASVQGLGGGSIAHGPDLHALVGSAPDLLADVSTVSNALTADRTALPDLFRDTNEIATRFVGRRGQIANLIRQTDDTFQGLTVDNAQPLSDSLRKLPGTLDHAQTAFAALRTPLADTRSSLDRLRSGAQGLGDATPDTRAFLRDSRSPLDRVPGVSDDAKPAVEDLTDTFRDARPLAPRVVETFDRLAEPLDAIAPYSKEFGYLFVRLNSFVSKSVAPGVHIARISAVVSPQTVLGNAVRDKFNNPRDEYPKPGAATFDRNGPRPGGK
jgi:phospholipid/cholesterol/gamma-HCH transport system substrate-binding protein